MPKKAREGKTRQVFASIDEGLYLAAKSQAAERRVPLWELIETALSQMLDSEHPDEAPEPTEQEAAPSIWNDEYLGMQSRLPVGSPVELAGEEAARVARAAFGSVSGDWSMRSREGLNG